MKGPVARRGQPLWRACEREHGGQAKRFGGGGGGSGCYYLVAFVTVENPSFDTTQGESLIATLPLGILDGTDEVIKVGISALCAGEMVGKALRAYPLKFNMVSKGLMSSSQLCVLLARPATDQLTPASVSC